MLTRESGLDEVWLTICGCKEISECATRMKMATRFPSTKILPTREDGKPRRHHPYDIRTVQELFGYKNVRTTQIHTHVLKNTSIIKKPAQCCVAADVQNFNNLFQRLAFSCYTEILFCNFGEFQLVKVGRKFL